MPGEPQLEVTYGDEITLLAWPGARVEGLRERHVRMVSNRIEIETGLPIETPPFEDRGAQARAVAYQSESARGGRIADWSGRER